MGLIQGILTTFFLLSCVLFASGASSKTESDDSGKTKTITIPSDADVKRVTVVEFVNGTSAMDTTRNSSPVILDLADTYAKKNLKARAKAPEAIATQSFNSTATSTTQSLSSTDSTTESSTVSSTTDDNTYSTLSTLSVTNGISTDSPSMSSEQPSRTTTAAPTVVSMDLLMTNPCSVLEVGLRTGVLDKVILPSGCNLFIPPTTVIAATGQIFNRGFRFSGSEKDLPDDFEFSIIKAVDAESIIASLNLSQSAPSVASSRSGVILALTNTSSDVVTVSLPVAPSRSPLYSSVQTESIIWHMPNPTQTRRRRRPTKSTSGRDHLGYPFRFTQQPEDGALFLMVPESLNRRMSAPTRNIENDLGYFGRR